MKEHLLEVQQQKLERGISDQADQINVLMIRTAEAEGREVVLQKATDGNEHVVDVVRTELATQATMPEHYNEAANANASMIASGANTATENCDTRKLVPNNSN